MNVGCWDGQRKTTNWTESTHPIVGNNARTIEDNARCNSGIRQSKHDVEHDRPDRQLDRNGDRQSVAEIEEA